MAAGYRKNILTQGRLGKKSVKYAAAAVLAGAWGVLRLVAHKCREPEDMDRDNPYLDAWEEGWNQKGSYNTGSKAFCRKTGISADSGGSRCAGSGKSYRQAGVYEALVKPAADHMMAFGALVLLAPVYGAVGLAVYLDDPGPIFFTQKRIGRGGHYFLLHKFRTMKMSAPHDVPTHCLEDPERYITGVGKVLRRTSLDELPQVWDIFRGKMSLIGPRPALWNQKDLALLRRENGAWNLLPGLTGLAQISGRDELEIGEKARLDGEYGTVLRQGGLEAFRMDVCLFFRTIVSVISSDGVAEGGGFGSFQEESAQGIPDTDTEPVQPKNILILGEGSYIGEALRAYLEEGNRKAYHVTTLNTVGLKPEKRLFEGVDVVFNAAGIAHVRETEENRRLYYQINQKLAVEAARAAKEAGVKQFIQLSSMSVYGMTTGEIDRFTVPYPTTFYGESKLAADETLEKLRDRNFAVALLRPPMVYGRGCRGNYQALRKFALHSPVFPKCQNRRSMIYIGNLCEFVKRVIDRESNGMFFPQNREYVCTSEMVKLAAEENGKKLVLIGGFCSGIKHLPLKVLRKVFGDLMYRDGDIVGKYGFEESIRLTERGCHENAAQ